MTDPVLDSVRRLAARTGMLPPGSHVLVAVSGGQDSSTLLHVLARLRQELSLTLNAAHLHHGIRGADADSDAEFAASLASSLDVPCTVERQDVREQARRLRISVQEAARNARIRFLEREADRVGASHIGLAHTQDDRVETILMNLLRGTGTDGLGCMPPVSGKRVRPLLEVSRAETAAYCTAHAIAFRHDASNLSAAYTRNRVREELLPLVEAYYNPAFKQALLRLAELATDDAIVLQQMAQDALDGALTEHHEGRLVLSTSALTQMPPAIRRRVVRLAVAKVRGDLVDVEFADIERALVALEEASRSGRSTRSTLFPGCYVQTGPVALEVFEHTPSSPRRLLYPLPCPGQVRVPEVGLTVRSSLSDPPDRLPLLDGPEAVLDAELVRLPLTVRNRRPGDRFQPLGMTGTRKLQDYLVDRKVPVSRRDELLLVADAEGILWAVGHSVSERGRVRASTRRVVRLEVEELCRQADM